MADTLASPFIQSMALVYYSTHKNNFIIITIMQTVKYQLSLPENNLEIGVAPSQMQRSNNIRRSPLNGYT